MHDTHQFDCLVVTWTGYPAPHCIPVRRVWYKAISLRGKSLSQIHVHLVYLVIPFRYNSKCPYFCKKNSAMGRMYCPFPLLFQNNVYVRSILFSSLRKYPLTQSIMIDHIFIITKIQPHSIKYFFCKNTCSLVISFYNNCN